MLHTHIHTYMHMHIYISLYTHIYIYMCMYVCILLCSPEAGGPGTGRGCKKSRWAFPPIGEARPPHCGDGYGLGARAGGPRGWGPRLLQPLPSFTEEEHRLRGHTVPGWNLHSATSQLCVRVPLPSLILNRLTWKAGVVITRSIG